MIETLSKEIHGVIKSAVHSLLVILSGIILFILMYKQILIVNILFFVTLLAQMYAIFFLEKIVPFAIGYYLSLIAMILFTTKINGYPWFLILESVQIIIFNLYYAYNIYHEQTAPKIVTNGVAYIYNKAYQKKIKIKNFIEKVQLGLILISIVRDCLVAQWWLFLIHLIALGYHGYHHYQVMGEKIKKIY